MNLVRMISALALSLAAVACATPAPTSLAFSPQSTSGLLVAAGPRTSLATSVELRRVNMETLQFEDEIVSVVNAGLGGNQINHQSNIWLSIREIEGGDYALVSLTTNTFNGYASGQAWRCLYSGAPVFTLPAGQISIVQLNEFWMGAPNGLASQNPIEAHVLQEFESARVRYPGIAGEAIVVAPHAAIHWDERRGIGMTRNCLEPAGFSIMGDKGY